MNCEETRMLIEKIGVSSEMKGKFPPEFLLHIEECHLCREQFQSEVMARDFFGALERVEAPEDFTRRLMRRLREETSSEKITLWEKITGFFTSREFPNYALAAGIAVAMLILTINITFMTGPALIPPEKDTAAITVASIKLLEGTAGYRETGITERYTIEGTFKPEKPLRLFTGKASAVELLFKNGTRAIVGADSSIDIQSGNFANTLRIAREANILVVASKAPAPFRIESPAGYVEVRGTVFGVAGNQKGLETSVFEGQVAFGMKDSVVQLVSQGSRSSTPSLSVTALDDSDFAKYGHLAKLAGFTLEIGKRPAGNSRTTSSFSPASPTGEQDGIETTKQHEPLESLENK